MSLTDLLLSLSVGLPVGFVLGSTAAGTLNYISSRIGFNGLNTEEQQILGRPKLFEHLSHAFKTTAAAFYTPIDTQPYKTLKENPVWKKYLTS